MLWPSVLAVFKVESFGSILSYQFQEAHLIIWQVLGVFGGATVIATGLSVWIGKLIQARATIHWQRHADQKLADFQQHLDREKLRLESVLSHYSGLYSAAQEQRIDAARSVWSATLTIRETASGAIFFYTVLSENEYDNAISNPGFHAAITKTKIDDLAGGYFTTLREIEKLRPLIGDHLWGIFSVYGSFSGRLVYRLREQAAKGHISAWHDDKGIQQFIEALFTSEEQKGIDLRTPLSLQRVVWQIESKIVSECSRIVSGSAAMSESLSQTAKIQSALEAYGMQNQRTKTTPIT
jgi:hypothetical protein